MPSYLRCVKNVYDQFCYSDHLYAVDSVTAQFTRYFAMQLFCIFLPLDTACHDVTAPDTYLLSTMYFLVKKLLYLNNIA
jgi:uncharacterized membrane protein